MNTVNTVPRRRRYYGEKMLADGDSGAYPPTPSEERQWMDGVGYNSIPNGTVQYVDPSGNSGPKLTTYQKPTWLPTQKSGQPTQQLMADTIIHGKQPLQQLMMRMERVSPPPKSSNQPGPYVPMMADGRNASRRPK